ncbi:hypothetical protein AZE42_13504 [Rhizopogon vesiculosus]|uniref:Uncharacterized protein n=1 Tax=Rhizopogon vesiculosus TaxID=180088 RepID=A0A1J8QLX7_9AGAM|nr:hypothetical protein AZE42_13504 [Rhizopogon vesiculosus]
MLSVATLNEKVRGTVVDVLTRELAFKIQG